MNEQAMLEQLIADGVISPTADAADNQNWTFYAIRGFNPDQNRLAVWQGKEGVVWSITGFDPRGAWYSIGDRPDLNPDNIPSCSWRDDCGDDLKEGAVTPSEWLLRFAHTADEADV